MNAGSSSKSQNKGAPKDSNQNDKIQHAGLGGLDSDKVVSDLSTLEAHINLAKLKDIDCVTVSHQVFDYLSGKHPTPFIMYKDIRVYREGTQDELEKLEGMTPDQVIDFHAKKKS